MSESDDDDDGKPKKGKKNRPAAGPAAVKKGARLKECPGCGSKVGVSIKECPNCDYTFTSRSNLVQQASVEEESANIRGRFPFEPERDEDGSLMIEKLMGRRLRKDKARQYHKSSQFVALSAQHTKYDHEYLVKYKTLSYLHVQWCTAHEIDTMSQRSKMALNRYLKAIDTGGQNIQEDGEVDPSYVEVEKILDVREEDVFDTQDEKPLAAPTADLPISASGNEIKVSSSNLDIGSHMKSSGSSTNLSAEEPKIDPETGEIIPPSVTSVFKANERCRKVFEKMFEDPFAQSFIDPVDTDTYEDYLDIVEEPMCLSDVRQKLDEGAYARYGCHTQFAKDMRMIWSNCKLYNLHKSQIWHSAHCLSMMFERLYQGWVLSFSDGSISMNELIGCPWEPTCRTCATNENEDTMILCDHCDATFHLYCLDPPLTEVPEGSWYCPRCMAWFDSHPIAKRLTATAEDEAREATTKATTRVVVKVRKRKYLVKWRGQSHVNCTWELREDINDDEKINEFHALNDSPPDEPPLTQAELDAELRKERAKAVLPARIPGTHYNPLYELDSHIYAQIRAFHFIKWDKIPTEALALECGPCASQFGRGGRFPMTLPKDVVAAIEDIDKNADAAATASASSSAQDSVSVAYSSTKTSKPRSKSDRTPVVLLPLHPPKDLIESEVADMLGAMCSSVARNMPMNPYPARPKLPAPDLSMPSEIEVVVPKGPSGRLYFTAAEYNGRLVVFDWSTEKRGPLQLSGRVRLGDVLTAINGVPVVHLHYDKVVELLASTITPFIYLRFLRTKDQAGEAGVIARARADALANIQQLRFNAAQLAIRGVEPVYDPEEGEGDVYLRYLNARRPIKDTVNTRPIRSIFHGVFPCGGYNNSVRWTASYGLSSERKLSYSTRSDSECRAALAKLVNEWGKLVEVVNPHGGYVFDTEQAAAEAREQAMRDVEKAFKKSGKGLTIDANTYNFSSADMKERTQNGVILARVVMAERSEAELMAKKRTDYLASRNLLNDDMEINGGGTTSGRNRMDVDDDEDDEDDGYHSLDSMDSDSDLSSDEEVNDDDDRSEDDDEWQEDENGEWRPVKELQVLKLPDGPMSRLHRAVNESTHPPVRSDWQAYMLENYTYSALAAQKLNPNRPDIPGGACRKGVPVDQLDMATNSIIRTWKSANAASTSLQITQYSINNCCIGKIDSAGGFRFRYSDSVPNWLAGKMNQVTNEKFRNEYDDDEEGNQDRMDEEESAEISGAIVGNQMDTAWKSKLHKKSKEYKSGGMLRDYQVDGLNWLLRCWYQKRSSIIADEMGLGKTVQVVSFLDHIFEVEGLKGPFLVCVPLSTIEHWKREFESWSFMVTNVYHDTGGGRDMRDIIREFEWYYKGRSRRLLKFHVLITTYDDLIRDYEELAEIAWRVVVVDEAHRLRNTNSRLLECMRAVVSKGLSAYGYQHRVLMTGTPLQNNTDELWSLLNFIEPAKFPDFEKFKKVYGIVKTQDQVEGLQKRLGPHLLRRVKEDVAKDIPPKEETIIDVELTTTQKQYYRAIFEHNHGFLMQTVKGSMPKLMNIQMELRKVCNHPWLIGGVEETEMEKVEDELSASTRDKLGGLVTGALGPRKLAQRTPAQIEFSAKRMQSMVPTSGKMVLLDKLLPKLKREGHKVSYFIPSAFRISPLDC